MGAPTDFLIGLGRLLLQRSNGSYKAHNVSVDVTFQTLLRDRVAYNFVWLPKAFHLSGQEQRRRAPLLSP